MFRLPIVAITRQGYWFTKNSKRGWPLLTNSGYKIIAKFMIIILKTE